MSLAPEADDAGTATVPPLAAFTNAPPATLPPGASAAAVGIIGSPPGYEILAELGRGGMGVVYQARQTALQRIVALKMILGGGHASAADLQRFRTEAESIARLQHLHIVQIYEVGEYDGLPYFSLEFCAGGSLEKKLDGTPLPPREAAALVEKVARAMQAAHDKGVIHRDLKPANVLLAEDGTPKITDFGLAKKLDEVGKTQTGSIMGTPSYMSPEQAQGKSSELGPPCDIYALGAILYECLTGRPPFRAATPLDTVLQVVSEEPVPPTQLNARVPRDLETICVKCLHKEPAKRYKAAADLAADLRRFQAGEAIQARPVGKLERLWFWCRRNPALAAVSAAGLLALVAGTVVSLSYGIEASRSASELAVKEKETKAALDASETIRRQLEETDRKRRKFTRQSALLALEKGVKYWDEGDATLGALWLTRSLEMVEKQDADLERVIRSYLAHVPFFVHPLQALLPHDKQVWHIAFSPDGGRVVTTSGDGTARLWEVGTGKPLGAPMRHEARVMGAVFSPDGERIATTSDDSTARLWDGKTGQSLDIVLRHDDPVGALAYSPDGARIMTGDIRSVSLWDARNGKLLSKSTPRTEKGRFVWDNVTMILFGPGDELAAIQSRYFTGIVDGKTGQLVRVMQPDPKRRNEYWAYSCMALSPDGKRLATGGGGKQIMLRLWDTGTGEQIGEPRNHPATLKAVAFSPDGKLLASGSADGQVRFWDGETGQSRPAAHGRGMAHQADVEWIAFSADGKTLLTGSADGTARLWDVAGQTPLGGRLYQGVVYRCGFSKWGSVVATASLAGNGRLWGLAPSKIPTAGLPRLVGPMPDAILAQFTPDGTRVFAGNPNDPDKLSLWDVATAKPVLTLPAKGRIMTVAMSPTDNELITGSMVEGKVGADGQPTFDGVAELWDLTSGKLRCQPLAHGHTVFAVAFFPGGKTVLTAAASGKKRKPVGTDQITWNTWDGGELVRWDVASGQRAAGPWPVREVSKIQVCPDGATVLLHGWFGHEILPWHVASGQPAGKSLELRGTNRLQVGFDGRFAAVNRFFTVDVLPLPQWDQALHELNFQVGVTALDFAPDGKKLLTATMDGRCQLWDPATGKQTGQLTLPKGYAQTLAFAPDGKVLLVCTSERTARLWDVETGQPLGPELPFKGSAPPHAVFNKQGSHFLIQDEEAIGVYPTPAPVQEKVERLVLWTQVLTGLELDAEGRVRVMTATEWHERRHRLQDLGGPPR
jgi:WD40 repeat protein